MELACALVLLIIGSVTASPYGYGSFGPKGGAVAKADAHAAAGAYANPGSLPLSIPGSENFSGSFSQSSASSSSSSSASSGSFSYTGSGTSGGVLPDASGCGFGKCNTGDSHSSPGITGPQAHSGANTHFTGGYGGKIPSGSYGHKYDNYEKWDHTGYTQSPYNSNKCISGQCGPNEDSDEEYDSDGEYDDINVHGTGTTNSKSSYGKMKPGCFNGNCSPPSFLGSHSPSGYSNPTFDLTVPKLDPPCSEPHCHQSTSGYSSPNYNKSPYYTTSFQNEHNFGYVSSPGYGFVSKPSYAHGSSAYSPVQSPSNPSGPTSPGYHGSFSSTPTYSHGSTPNVNPSGCVPGNSGCISSPSVPSDCTSGNCGTNSPGYSSSPGINPNYSHGSQSSYSSVKPPNLPCTPGTPGCPTSQSGASCKFGNCGGYPTSGYEAIGNKPTYAHGNSRPSWANLDRFAGSCTTGTPGCGITQQTGSSNCASGNCGIFPSPQGYGGPSNVKPSYSQGGPYSHSTATPSVSGCAPGTFGCSSKPAINVPYTPTGCASGNCETYPSSAGSSSSSIKPSVSSDSLSSYAQKPLKPLCTPGSRGCSLPLSPGVTTGCTSGYCGEFSPPGGQEPLQTGKPSYSSGSSSDFPQKPSWASCTPGTPGCAPTPASNSVSGCTSGNCGSHSFSHGCAPGSPGCSGLPSSLNSVSQNVLPGLSTITTSIPVSGGSSYGSSYPSSQSVSSQSGVPSTTTEASENYDKKEEIPYTGGFGGPAGILKPHEYSVSPFPSSGHKPTTSIAPITAKPECVSGICNTQGVSSHSQSGVASDVHAGSGQHTTSGISTSGYSSSVTGSFGQPVDSGLYNTGSNTPFIKPAPIIPSAAGSASSSGSSTETGAAGSTVTTNAQSEANAGVPYTGGFGGPTGIYKPNEFNGSPVPSSGHKPTISTTSTTAKPDYSSPGAGSSGQQADSEIYNTGLQTPFIKPAPIIPSATGSASGIGPATQTGVIGSSVTANAQNDENEGVPYTGGFGGPAGIFKPNENSAGPIPSSGHKPTISTAPITAKPDCVSGICNTQGSSSLSHSESNAHAGTGQQTTSGISTSGYGSSNTGSSGQQADSGIYNTESPTPFIKPAPIIPSATGSAPGIGSSSQMGVPGPSVMVSIQEDQNEGLLYTGGFGGPAGILNPNEYSTDSIPSSGNEPIKSSSTTVKPNCDSGICNVQGSSALSNSGTASVGNAGSGQQVTTRLSTPGQGVSGAGSSVQDAALAIRVTGSPFLKPAPVRPSTSISVPSVGFSTQLAVSGTTVGASKQRDGKNDPPYIGGFGGPTGLLKPNENNPVSTLNLGNTPTVSSTPTTVKTNCDTGICEGQEAPSLSNSESSSGAQAAAAASASADVVAYTGGFGGPPGFLKPSDNNKAGNEVAAVLGSSRDLNQGIDAVDNLNDGSQLGRNTVAEATAAAVSSAGASSADSKFQSENQVGDAVATHSSAGGCGAGCGDSGGGSNAFSASLGFTKTLNGLNNGLASAGAVATSVANAASSARAFGSSYASSSASAHAGASIKGGYGRR